MRWILFFPLLSVSFLSFADATLPANPVTPANVNEDPSLLAFMNSTNPADNLGKPVGMKVTYPYGQGLKFSSPDGKTYMKVSGYFQAYSADFYGDTNDRVYNLANLKNGLYIPSGRITFLGALNSDWKYRFEYDFATSSLNYAYLNYVGWNHVELKGGEYKPAFNSASLTERVDDTFMEHALPVGAFSANYAVGTEALFYTDYFSFATGVFAPAQPVVNGIAITGSAPMAVNGRLNVEPIDNTKDLLHLGVGAYYRQALNGQYTQFRTFPEMASNNNSDICLVDTGVINNSQDYYVTSAEFINVAGSFTVEGEYYLATVNRSINPNLTFDGYYGAMSYFLTGETRIYDYLNGAFLGITKVLHSYGAWEVAFRFSNVDLNSQNILGGEENDATAALNWYPVQRVKLGAEYIYANATPSSNGLNRHVNIVGLMLQARF